METRNIFENISCIDHRYSLSEAEVFNGLSKYISEEASIRSCAKCEAALVKSHLKLRGKLTDEIAQNLDKVASEIDPAEVYAEEEKTKHNIRALVNVMKTKVSAEIGPLVHLGATSVDILDTALSCRMRDVTKNVVLPELKKLEKQLCGFAARAAEGPAVGSTCYYILYGSNFRASARPYEFGKPEIYGGLRCRFYNGSCKNEQRCFWASG